MTHGAALRVLPLRKIPMRYSLLMSATLLTTARIVTSGEIGLRMSHSLRRKLFLLRFSAITKRIRENGRFARPLPI